MSIRRPRTHAYTHKTHAIRTHPRASTHTHTHTNTHTHTHTHTLYVHIYGKIHLSSAIDVDTKLCLDLFGRPDGIMS